MDIDRIAERMLAAIREPIVVAVSDLGRSLDLVVVAEGVETAEQVELARRAGCHAAQGYWLGRPAIEEQTTALLRRSADILGPQPDQRQIDIAEPVDV